MINCFLIELLCGLLFCFVFLNFLYRLFRSFNVSCYLQVEIIWLLFQLGSLWISFLDWLLLPRILKQCWIEVGIVHILVLCFRFFTIKDNIGCGLFTDSHSESEEVSSISISLRFSSWGVGSCRKLSLHQLTWSYDFYLFFYWCGVLC